MAKELMSIVSVNGDELFGYKWIANNPVGNVVIVTGMEEYAGRYDDFANFLNESGLNVYSIDLYGQGLNSKDGKLGTSPTSSFSKEVRIVDDLVKLVSKNKLPTSIFAHSMGSFILQDYIQRFAKHVDRVIICGSNGKNGALAFKFGYKVAKLIVNEKNEFEKAKLFKKLAFGGYCKRIKPKRTEFDWLSYNNENVDKYIADPLCGYGSTNSFYREFMKGGARLYKKKFLAKISPDLHIYIVAGKDDPVGAYTKGPKSLYKMYKEIGVKDVRLKIYENMRHEILNEKDNMIVYQDILSFIKG